MPKIVYENGTEQEIDIVGSEWKQGEVEYHKFVIKDKNKENLRDTLVQVMQARQAANLLPYEIVEGMLCAMGNGEFGDDLWFLVKEAHLATLTDQPSLYVDKVVTAFLKKWGLRN